MEEWLKNETERQQRALDIKEERRRERRASHNLQKTQQLQLLQQDASNSEVKAAASTDDAEQKMKFLRVRSWREIYGTGEGKELMKQHQHTVRSPSLRDLRKKAHQSFASLSQSPTRAEDRQQLSSQAQSQVVPPPPPPITQSGSVHDHLYSLGTDQFVPPPPPPQSMPPTVSGAFMQEMNDDEITMEMEMEEEQFANGIPPPPPPPEEFTDHGLSYYYDPSAPHNLVPAPPEFDEQSKFDTYFDACEEEEDDIPLEQPPPPPPSEPPRLSLLEEIQLGTALRSVHEPREAPARALSPQVALLQQILQKQSRHLRPVETRRPNPPTKTASSTAPFADSIARILERRAMIAYDSDSAESHKSSNGSNEDEDDW